MRVCVSGDKFFWFRDEEFARQTLAGVNPCCIKLITVHILPLYIQLNTTTVYKNNMFYHIQEWPIKSKLDPEIYGPQESAITTDMIRQEIGGIMRVDEVIIN